MRVQLIPLCLTVALAACGGEEEPKKQEKPEITMLEQGWDSAMQALFYHTPQGSRLLPYDWFLALEQPEGSGLLRDEAYLDGLRFIPNANDAGGLNPDLLPIGFTKEPPQRDTKEAQLGLTCSACHTGQIEHGEHTIRIDGGAAMVDMTGFYAALHGSLTKTAEDDARFARFAKRVLGNDASDDASSKLRSAVKKHQASMPKESPHAGFGRQDAFGRILNDVTSLMLDQPENLRKADAPASYPCLWDTPRLAWVQWNGLAANPIGRNVGEVFGTFGNVNLTASGDKAADLFESSARVRKLHELEQWVADLKPPKWREEILGKIDDEKAKRGEQIYRNQCQQCHSLKPYPLTEKNEFGYQFIRVNMIPVETIGTDPRLIQNMLTRVAKTGNLSTVIGKPEVPAVEILVAATVGAFKRLAKELQLTKKEQLELSGFRTPGEKPPNLKAYKARPLDGVWATAPYLHNGSVPNLYEMLLPPDQRSKKFHVGSRKFDPIRVGFETAPGKGTYEIDTSVPGAMNVGHAFGPTTDEDRWALVEFLKRL